MHDDLANGLVHFYSSQAEFVLSQYENINQLLGPTTDWTHPGTHCEILIRDFLRKHLLQGMSVDRGFVFGRVQRDDRNIHGPEIDVLIHNSIDYRPVFRLEDFVIVQPEAVLGMIQVKRTLRAGKGASLAKGIRQVVDAKQHLLDVTVQHKVEEMTDVYRGDVSKVKTFPEWPDMKPAFTGIVSFEDETDKKPETYRQALLDVYRENRSCVHPESKFDTGVYVLPDFVGSLKGVSLCAGNRNLTERRYTVFDSLVGGKNVALQLLLTVLTDIVFDFRKKHPPFSFPKALSPLTSVQVPRPSESLHKHAAAT